MKKKLIALLAVLLAALSVFASGAKEITSDETVLKVLAIEVEEDGTYRATVQKEDGTVIIYRADENQTISSVPFEQIHEGSVLAIKDNGIATMSLPAQMWATEIRDLSLGVALGAYDFSFQNPTTPWPGMSEEETQLFEITLADSLEERFSYAYAYDLLDSYISQGVVFRASYFSRGVLDFWNQSKPLIDTSQMNADVNTYIETVFNTGAEEASGPAPESMDEIYAISDFEDISQRFSYAYGYVSAFQDYYYGIVVNPEAYVKGALSRIYDVTPLMNEDERAGAVNAYILQMQQEYEAYLANLASDNLEIAENFLEENGLIEGIVTTASGLQIETITEGDGATPAEDDTVIVNYTLRNIDGNLLDSGTGAQFALSGLIPGFSEAVMNMRVGGEVIAYVHPSLGYGESGAGTIEPNSLLIFDIELEGIVE